MVVLGITFMRLKGVLDTFIWTVNASGQLLLEDVFVDGEGYNATNQGTDTLSNIQAIRYIREDGTIEYTLEVDDHGMWMRQAIR